MSERSSAPSLVFDTTCLSHFARADRIDVLGELVSGWHSATTSVVREEIRTGRQRFPQLSLILCSQWLEIVSLDASLDRISRFVNWSERVGARNRDLGEASVLALAEEREAIAIIDDRHATRVGRAHGARVHGTLWLLGSVWRDGKITEAGAASLVEALVDSGMRLPCSGRGFGAYARRYGLGPT